MLIFPSVSFMLAHSSVITGFCTAVFIGQHRFNGRFLGKPGLASYPLHSQSQLIPVSVLQQLSPGWRMYFLCSRGQNVYNHVINNGLLLELKRSTQVQYNYNKITQKFCCIAAVCTSTIQLQYKFFLQLLQVACKFSASYRKLVLQRCIAGVCTRAIQLQYKKKAFVLQLIAAAVNFCLG